MEIHSNKTQSKNTNQIVQSKTDTTKVAEMVMDASKTDDAKKLVAPVVKRASRLPVAAVLAHLAANKDKGATVPAMAEVLKCPERDIRLAIDRLRATKHTILRTELKTFKLTALPPAAAKA